MNQSLADRIDALLPQTQCTRCGYPDCWRYAEAVADGRAAINRCPPGGEGTVAHLAELTGRPTLPLNPDCGAPAPPMVAVIDENWCIGCVICLRYCPVDAIVGAPKRMHTVIGSECTGCELCVAPCPVDCIRMVPADVRLADIECWLAERAPRARERYRRRRRRLDLQERERRRRRRRVPTMSQRKADIDAARTRVRARRPRPAGPDTNG